MAPARASRRKAPPLSGHPAFVPLVTLWCAAMLGGSMAVMPAGRAVGLVAQTGFALPQSAFPEELMIAVAAALTGGVIGFAMARVLAAIQSRVSQPGRAEAPAQQALAGVEVEPAEVMPADIAPAEPGTGRAPDLAHGAKVTFDAVTFESVFEPSSRTEPELWPEAPSHHGKAVQLLRSHDTANLAMPQLIERFAVALDDHLERARLSADTYSVRKPPAGLAEGLQRLKRA